MTALRDFLVDWLAWAEAGGGGLSPAGKPYGSDVGLCTNVCFFSFAASERLDERLFSDLGDASWPFGVDNYAKRQREGTQHQCLKRLAWARKTIEELSE